jgi:hypothetical protein
MIVFLYDDKGAVVTSFRTVIDLPAAPVSREAVWYQGPNFGTAYYYDEATDTLYFHGGFHDYRIGMMRVQHFLHPDAVSSK